MRDITEHTFGHLTALAFHRRVKDVYFWTCRCVCGDVRQYRRNNLTSGTSKSCGCKKSDAISAARTKHGRRGEQVYEVWADMIARCHRSTHHAFANYGGRGIIVCERWRVSFAAFIADMGERPDGMTVERNDVNGNYEPGNCRWATRKEQARNKRNNHLVTIGNERLCIGEWADRTGLSGRRIHSRIKRGWSEEKAILTPLLK